jgi:hypothetical protein
MKKVWILWYSIAYDDFNILGVFDSSDKAYNALKVANEDLETKHFDYDVKEFEVS